MVWLLNRGVILGRWKGRSGILMLNEGIQVAVLLRRALRAKRRIERIIVGSQPNVSRGQTRNDDCEINPRVGNQQVTGHRNDDRREPTYANT